MTYRGYQNIAVGDLAHMNIDGQLHAAASDPEGRRTVRHLVTDSRNVLYPADTVFAAVRTAVGDGHRYIAELYGRGVGTFIVERLDPSWQGFDAAFIVVPDVKEALARLAYARLRGNECGILIVGSEGKTETKELLYRVLKPWCEVQRSPRSWNSAIGFALAAWDMGSSATLGSVLISEAAIDGPGQAENIHRMIGYTYHLGVVTPVTAEHDEAFANHAAKVAEKVAMLAGLDTIVYCDSDPELRRQLEALPFSPRLIAVAPGKDLEATVKALVKATVRVMKEDGPYHLQRSVEKVAVSDADIDAMPMVDTQRTVTAGIFGNSVVVDRFNADLRSLRDAMLFMYRRRKSRGGRVLVLGRLMEPFTCKAVEDMASDYDFDKVIFADGSEPSRLAADIENGSLMRDCDVLFFGDSTASFDACLQALEGTSHDTELRVDLDNLIHNYNHYRNLVRPGAGVIAMVKASAYGMGAVEVSRALQSNGAPALAVAVVEEGIALREAGITIPIIVMNPMTRHYNALFSHGLEPSVFSMDELQTLLSAAVDAGVSDYPVHIKVDTGMHRVGFLPQDIKDVCELLKGNSRLRVKSVFTHLATADCLDKNAYTEGQIRTFTAAADALDAGFGRKVTRHFLNTAGMMRYAWAAPYDMARLGIGLYGISPLPGMREGIRPVAAFTTSIISLKDWPEGTFIGYGNRGRVDGSWRTIATIPVGYADGINRHMGCGAASFYVDGTACPTIGNICMDQCMIDVTDCPTAAVGSEVEIFGPHQPVEALADVLGTIPYEILTSISPRVKRIYTCR